MKKIEELKNLAIEYNQAYRKGTPLVPDAVYDKLMEEIKELDPTVDLFPQQLMDPVSGERKSKLPIPMYSLEKIKSVGKLRKWISDTWQLEALDRIIITPKYDGISLCVDEMKGHCWTRGNGEVGQRSDEWYSKMNQNKYGTYLTGITYGEAIIKKDIFEKIKGDFKTARNLVAGIFNADSPSDMIEYVDFVRYGYEADNLSKSILLDGLRQEFNSTDYTTFYASMFVKMEGFENNYLDDDQLTQILDDLFCVANDTYCCDGIVIEVDDAFKRNELGRLPNNNPRYAVAYKDPKWVDSYKTTVREIEVGVSRNGKLTPVAIFDPILINGVTVTRATLHNMQTVFDENIAEGSEILITRSGDVIPYFLETVTFDVEKVRKLADDLATCPHCGEPTKWDGADLVCENPQCKPKMIDSILFFCKIMEFEEIGEPTVRKLYENGCRTIDQLLGAASTREELIKILGKSSGAKLHAQIKTLKENGCSLAKYMTAMNLFEGTIAEKTAQMIFNNLEESAVNDYLLNCRNKDFYLKIKKSLLGIKGVAEKTAQCFLGALSFLSTERPLVKISFIREELKEIKGIAVFTGFRDKDLEKKAISAGYQIGSSITNKTTVLVMKELGSGSSKEDKAKKLGIQIVTKEQFESEVLL